MAAWLPGGVLIMETAPGYKGFTVHILGTEIHFDTIEEARFDIDANADCLGHEGESNWIRNDETGEVVYL